MKTTEAIAWFKRSFGERILAGLEGTPFSVDLVAAIAQQETGYIWAPLVSKGLPENDVLRLCVGDTLDADRGRSCFPRNKAELLRAPRGAEMFAIARQALLDMARHVNGYAAATINPNKFCHGYGIFQYDLQFFETNPAFFLERAWENFDNCLAQFVAELKQAATRQRWGSKTRLTDDEQIFVAIAYNSGSANCSLGFKQGHESDGKCYGENICEFLRVAKSIPLNREAPAPSRVNSAPEALPALFKKLGAVFEVDVQGGPLRLRSEPRIPAENAAANVIGRLPKGHLVQRVGRRKAGEFIEVETIWNGAELRGFASGKYLRRVKRATPVKKTPKRTRKRKTLAAGATVSE